MNKFRLSAIIFNAVAIGLSLTIIPALPLLGGALALANLGLLVNNLIGVYNN